MKMFLHFRFLILSVLCFTSVTYGQIIVTDPALPTDNKSVKITFDATKGTAGLKDYTGDVYAHTGVITDKSTSSSDWKYVKTSWGTNTSDTKLTRTATNTYELNITPDIRTYYGVPAGEKILKLAFVFRSSDSQKEGKDTGSKDIFVDVYEDVYTVNITNPTDAQILANHGSISLTAVSTENSTFTLKINNEDYKTYTETSSISENLTFDTPGDYWIKLTGTNGTTTKADSVYVTVYDGNNTETVPAGIKKGINYIDNTTVTLMLYAPYKSFVYVIGDFNNWLPSANYRMKKDGNNYWITLNNLTPQKEYIFQYYVDGSIRIADPYTEKVSDPYDDQYISSDVYPNLITYPSGKTSERASVLQTGQTAYNWTNTTFTVPSRQDLMIYELHIRDFTEEGTIKAAQAKLPYLKNLGINAIELMPINEFEGNSSWGYNPNFYFAPDKAYGTKNDYKDFIDACHGYGIMVIQDMVLNHSYGSSPLVRLYWDDANSRPAANNPWYNVTSPNTTYSWGYDFNHESKDTKNFVDSVNRFWMSQYKIDGFRFDFAKGFTNTAGEGSTYDASRMAILKRMGDSIWSYNPKAYIILEYFVDNAEEKAMSNYSNGMMVWGNANYSFGQASMGFLDGSDFSWASASSRGYTQPGLVSYMESHDEERMMYRNITYGNASGSYNIKNSYTALKRSGEAAAFFLSIPGPKMIWQFGELGYDFSIDYNERVGEKPVHWEYFQDTARYNKVYKIYRSMIALRKLYPVFTEGTISMSVSSSLMKRILLSSSAANVDILGNFDVNTGTITSNFQHTGTWYEFFTGTTMEVTSTTQQISLQPGEYRLYSDVEFPSFSDLGVNVDPVINQEENVLIYPNPCAEKLWIETPSSMNWIEMYTMTGKKLFSLNPAGNSAEVSTSALSPGVYFLKISSNGKTVTRKIVKK